MSPPGPRTNTNPQLRQQASGWGLAWDTVTVTVSQSPVPWDTVTVTIGSTALCLGLCPFVAVSGRGLLIFGPAVGRFSAKFDTKTPLDRNPQTRPGVTDTDRTQHIVDARRT